MKGDYLDVYEGVRSEVLYMFWYHALYDDNALCLFDYRFIASAIRSAMYKQMCAFI